MLYAMNGCLLLADKNETFEEDLRSRLCRHLGPNSFGRLSFVDSVLRGDIINRNSSRILQCSAKLSFGTTGTTGTTRLVSL